MSSDDVLLTGLGGELTERLCGALEHLGEQNTGWLETPILRLALDIQAPADYRNLDPSLAAAVIARRTLDLVDHGIGEDFLVTALRDRVTTVLRHQTDTATADRNRADALKGFQDLFAQPDLFRSRMAADRPGRPEAEWSDEEIQQQAERLTEMLSPVNADEALRAWSALDLWIKLTGESLSDDQIDHWCKRRELMIWRRRSDE